jgi:hypothetical protein
MSIPGSFGNSLGDSEWIEWALGIPLGIPESLRLCSIEPPEAVVIDVGLAELFPPSEVGKSTAPKVMGHQLSHCNDGLNQPFHVDVQGAGDVTNN